MSDDESRLSPGQLAYLASKVAEGSAEPHEALDLLAEFVACVNNSDPIPERLLEHLRDAFSKYLGAKQDAVGMPSIDRLGRALGLVRSTRGNPGTDEDRARGIALSIFRDRLGGGTHQDAIDAAIEKWNCGRTTAADAWRDHRIDALTAVRVQRAMDGVAWTEEELRRLAKMFRDRPEAVPQSLRRSK